MRSPARNVSALSIADVLAGIRVSKPSVYKMIAANKFAGSVKIGGPGRSPIGACAPLVGIITVCGFVD